MKDIGCSMNLKKFEKCFHEIEKKLLGKEVGHIFNSIGFHIFIEFGKDLFIEDFSGKKKSKKKWTIWIGNASWRLSKDNNHIVGSDDVSSEIKTHLKKILKKRILSLKVNSQFFDLQINFEDGYQINTFFNWLEDDQWTVFFPDQTNISIDCSDKSDLSNLTELSNNFVTIPQTSIIPTPMNNLTVSKIEFDHETNQPTIYLENNYSIHFLSCVWRLEKDGKYITGALDDDIPGRSQAFSDLLGKKIIKIEQSSKELDTNFIFEDKLVLKTFSSSLNSNRWKIYSGSKPLFRFKS